MINNKVSVILNQAISADAECGIFFVAHVQKRNRLVATGIDGADNNWPGWGRLQDLCVASGLRLLSRLGLGRQIK